MVCKLKEITKPNKLSQYMFANICLIALFLTSFEARNAFFANSYTSAKVSAYHSDESFTWLFILGRSLVVLDRRSSMCLKNLPSTRPLDAEKRIRKHTTSSPYSNPDQYLKSKIQSSFAEFGAKGDGITDDTKAISKALNSPYPVIYASKAKLFYKVSNIIVIKDVNGKKLIATGAKILNTDITKATFLFQNCNDIKVIDGQYGYSTMPTSNGGNSQHVFQFNYCKNILINNIHILNSPEMGIAITNSINVTIQNSLIEHTFRDGTYSHYSANVKYTNNKYNNIKDDAMSFHDYGISSQKLKLSSFGYKQAYNFLAKGNLVENSYQGISTIGASNVVIKNNKFRNTVLAGIAILNSKELYSNGTSLAKNVQVLDNRIENACSNVNINSVTYLNNGQASTGRAALFVGSLGTNNQVNAGETKILTNITVKNNQIFESKANGFFGSYTKGLNFTDNKFTNCSGADYSKSLAGDVIEIGNVTDFWGNNNTIVDTRNQILHVHGYALNNVSGNMGKWNVKRVLRTDSLLTNTPSLKVLPSTVKVK